MRVYHAWTSRRPLSRFLVSLAPAPGQPAPGKRLVRVVDGDLGERNDPAFVAGFQTNPQDAAVQRLIPGSERGGGGIVELHDILNSVETE